MVKDARVLVVDDEPLMRSLVVTFLERTGAQAVGAENGRAALAHMDNNPVDALVTDIVMPEMDGVTLIAETRKKFPHIKIVAMTGQTSGQDVDFLAFARKTGADEVLGKPIDNDALLKTLIKILSDLTITTDKAEPESTSDETEQLTLERNRYQSLSFCIGDACLEFDKDQVITFAIGAYDRLLKVDAASLVGKNINDVVHPQDAKRFFSPMEKAKNQGKSEGINVRLKVDGHESIPLQFGIRWRDADGGRFAVVFLGHRIGDHANLEG